eukprot:TRINITY_DN824_c0_g1_i15.p1 TRINITY_DN824_c0_g1~~TRINITY_DN824_c0_g1_i15.p1  ORF type:complete len:323 (+),score=56.26 TRINITY_DN824_c0_g1_i15:57-971(+)
MATYIQEAQLSSKHFENHQKMPERIDMRLDNLISKEFNKNRKLTLIGTSGCSERTALYVPELQIALDFGVALSPRREDLILITHVHNDHVGAILTCQSATKPPKILLPKESVVLMKNYFDVATRMVSHIVDGELSTKKDPMYEFVGVSPYETFAHKQLRIQIVDCCHSIPCRGYVVYEERNILRDDLKGITGKEIAKLRKAGEKVTTTKIVGTLAFLGDTTAEVFHKHPEILDCPVVIVECTSFGDFRAQRGHLHWDNLKPIVLDHPEITFVLIHFSNRFKPHHVKEFFGKEDLPNVVPWVDYD